MEVVLLEQIIVFQVLRVETNKTKDTIIMVMVKMACTKIKTNLLVKITEIIMEINKINQDRVQRQKGIKYT